jgi:transcriptional regulator with XRE-family HTH domain
MWRMSVTFRPGNRFLLSIKSPEHVVGVILHDIVLYRATFALRGIRPDVIRLTCLSFAPKLHFTMSIKNPNPIDRHVGARIRAQRMVCGISQTKLGDEVGVSFQQVQKYEKGVNRISASRMQQIANVLKVPPDFFFDGASTRVIGNSGSKETAIIEKFISSRDGIALFKAFSNIRDPKMRRSIVALVEQIVEG